MKNKKILLMAITISLVFCMVLGSVYCAFAQSDNLDTDNVESNTSFLDEADTEINMENSITPFYEYEELKYIDKSKIKDRLVVRRFSRLGVCPFFMRTSAYHILLNEYIREDEFDKYTYKIDDEHRLAIFKYDDGVYYYEMFTSIPPQKQSMTFINSVDGKMVQETYEFEIPEDIDTTGLWYTTTEGYYVSASLKSSDFDSIKIGDTLNTVCAIDPLVKRDINLRDLPAEKSSEVVDKGKVVYSSRQTPTAYRLLEDGVLKIQFTYYYEQYEDGSSNWDTLTMSDYTVYSIEFFPYGQPDGDDHELFYILNAETPIPLPKA